MKTNEVNGMTEQEAKAYLKKLIQKLDEMDKYEFFGIAGWRLWVMGENKN